MRSDRVIGATLLVLAFGAADAAEARGRGARAAVRSASIGSAAVAATGSIGVVSAQAEAGSSDPASRPVKAVIAPGAPEREVRAAGSWCAPRRLVGTGTGFCLIN